MSELVAGYVEAGGTFLEYDGVAVTNRHLRVADAPLPLAHVST